jgi:iron complex outermembrane receptor protein
VGHFLVIRYLLGISSLTTLASLGAAPAWAQQIMTEEGTAGDSAEEIIVTGLRDKAGGSISVGILGDRSLLDTPFSVQGFERNLLDQRIARGLRQVLDNDPSVQFETTAGSYADTLIIRGYSVSNFYLDGFSGPASSQPNLTLDIVDRIEVLRGPSALVFGGADSGGGVGGAVNYIPKRAPTEGRIGSATLGLEGRSSAFITGDIGGRVGKDGMIGYRFVGSYQNGELVANDHKREVLALLASFNVRATDRLSFTLDIAHFDEKQDGYQDVLGIPSFDLPPPPNPRRNIANPWTEYDTLRTYGILKADWEFSDDWTLSAGVARTRYRNYYFGGALVELIAPASGQPYRGEAQINPATSDGTIDTISGYGRLRGKFNTGGISHDLTVSARLDRSEANFPFASLTGPLATNIYNPIVSPRPQVVPGSEGLFAYDLKTQTIQVADFIGLTNRLTLLAGAGYVRIKEETIGYNQGRASPIAALLWKPADTVSLYASYAEALEQGGVAPMLPGITNPGEPQAPRVSEQIEAGAKFSFGKINATLAAFDIARGLEFVRVNSDGTSTYVQEGIQRHRGLELSLFGNITPRLFILAGASFIDPKIERNGDPLTEGKEPAGVSRTNLRLFGTYNFDFGLGFTAGLRHKSGQWLTNENTQRTPDFTVFDAGINLALDKIGVPAIFRVQIDNIFDKRYYNGVSFGGFGLSIGDARTLRASISTRF